MKKLCELKINDMIMMCETWIESEQEKKNQKGSCVVSKLEIIISDLKQLAKMID